VRGRVDLRYEYLKAREVSFVTGFHIDRAKKHGPRKAGRVYINFTMSEAAVG
jgi:hypothetical protein